MIVWAAVMFFITASVRAEIELSAVFSDGMVLQRDAKVRIWGWDAPGTEVSVAFRDNTIKATAEKSGKWLAELPSGHAGGPFVLTVSGSTQKTIQDVLVGEVWVSGGQSNMWWHVSSCTDAATEINNAQYPQVRMFDANTSPIQAGWSADKPQRTVKGQWKPATPQTVGDFPGIPYFFARELHEKLDHMPVGIVQTSVPGTAIEAWISPETAAAHLPHELELLKQKKLAYPAAMQKYEADHKAWEQSKEQGKPNTAEPAKPADPTNAGLGVLYNGMIAPLAGYTAKGFIWWQGEANSDNATAYTTMFPALIDDWRWAWGDDRLPFLYVELANFGTTVPEAVQEAPWPALRDAQRSALRLADTYMISAIDILETPGWNIHPPRKQMTGHRLALTALANVYGQKGFEWCGPELADCKAEGSTLVLSFKHVGGGLVAKGEQITGFAVAGADREFHNAQAKIVDDRVVLSCPQVANPIAARYDWANYPTGNLFNKEGFPVSQFRTDQWYLLKPHQNP